MKKSLKEIMNEATDIYVAALTEKDSNKARFLRDKAILVGMSAYKNLTEKNVERAIKGIIVGRNKS